MRFWGGAQDDTGGPSAQVRPGLRVYAIGDIHGEADLLDDLAEMIASDCDRAQPDEAVTMFLGDYIDRGPHSNLVLDRLVRADFPTPIVCLRGNHEQMLLDGLADPGMLKHWLFNGGIATAKSYRLPAEAYTGPDDLAQALQAGIPQSHLDFLAATALSHSIEDYFFCHAGIQPGVALDRQTPETLLWIRAPFHKSRADHGQIIVHGHTPVAAPELLRNRINIDTGAFKTGVLTCLVLSGREQSLLSTPGWSGGGR